MSRRNSGQRSVTPERVDFYVLNQADETSRLGFACVVTAKAWHQGMRVYLQVDSEDTAVALDDMLWRFQAASFVPHARVGTPQAAVSPVLIGREPAPAGWRRMLVSLTEAFPEGAAGCRRVADFIVSDEAGREAGRNRFRTWRAMGVTPGTHEITL